MSTNRPAWMAGGTPKPKTPARTIAPQSVPPQLTTHRIVVIGITLLAVMILFTTFFWVGFGLVSVINPPSRSFSGIMDDDMATLDDYFTFGRVLICTISGVVGTVAAWAIAESVID